MIRVGLVLVVTGWLTWQIGEHVGGGWLMTAGVGLLVMRVRRRARYRSIRIHTHGGHGTRTAAEHEDGHFRVGKGMREHGVRTGRAWINPDGSGVTEIEIPRDADPNIDIAISRAGRIASGTSSGCGGTFLPDRGSDNWHVSRAVRRGGSVAAGDRLARQQLGRTRSRAAELFRNGEIR